MCASVEVNWRLRCDSSQALDSEEDEDDDLCKDEGVSRRKRSLVDGTVYASFILIKKFIYVIFLSNGLYTKQLRAFIEEF